MLSKRLFVCCLVVAIAMPVAPLGFAADKDIDLDANPLTGEESTVETNVLQSFPVEVENVITNNSPGTAFSFRWPGAGPGGFDSILTIGPDVGTKWTWTTVSQVYSITSAAEFEVVDRGVSVFGAPPNGIALPAGDRVYDVPGKSIFPTQVTVSSAALTSSLVTFFSPENTIATCESNFVPGRFEQTISNNTGETVVFSVDEPDCCPEPQMTICEDGCQFYLTDVNNCGGCGITCDFDQTCEQGTCEDICPGPTDEYCDEVCVETSTDENNCGDCDIVCDFDQTCEQGDCTDICPGPTDEYCDEVCVETTMDVNNCGDCGIVCDFDQFCDEGVCADICPGPTDEYCDEVCVETATDVNNCGDCGITCDFDQYCGGGVCADICPGPTDEYCNEVCVDTATDDNNCGDCGVTCAFDEFCGGGVCAAICPGVGQAYCDDVCVDTLNDADNCGLCGVTCAFDEFCDAGSCSDICPGATEEYCDEVCVDTATDESNCGDCGVTCAFDEFCDAGACSDICPGSTDEYCNEECVDTATDDLNCGACGVECAVDEDCDSGVCTLVCAPPTADFCDGLCVDLSSDRMNCGTCGNVCGDNAICDAGECYECRGQNKDRCGNVCTSLRVDPFNCGECGFVCDFSNCPSSGQGACSQGNSCVCDDSNQSAFALEYEFSPVPVDNPFPDSEEDPVEPAGVSATPSPIEAAGQAKSPARELLENTRARHGRRQIVETPPSIEFSAPGSAATDVERGSARGSRRSRDGRREVQVVHRTVQPAESVASELDVIEAPVCAVPPIEVEIPDGESYTLCQSGALIGKEIFTTASVEKDGQTVGQGPCALIVPDVDATVPPFLPSAVGVTIVDESGDRLLQPGENAEIFIEVLNIGDRDMIGPTGVLSSPPDGFNPLPIELPGNTSAFPDFPALTEPADCDTDPVLLPQTNVVAYSVTIPREQEGGVGRVFNLNLQGEVDGFTSVDMPLVLGIGEACEFGPGFDGNTFDGLAGLLAPVNTELVPLGYDVGYGTRSFSRGDDIPLIVRLKCGEQVLGLNELREAPEVFAIRHPVVGDVPLASINADGGNANDPFFDCGVSTCEFMLNADDLPTGRITIEIRMPNSRVFHAGLRIIP